jgi:hypothetical protein
MTTLKNMETGDLLTIEGPWVIVKENLYRVTVDVLLAVPVKEDCPGYIEDMVSAIFTDNLEAKDIIRDWGYYSLDDGISYPDPTPVTPDEWVHRND